MKRVLAFDFGASSGRAMLGSFDGEKITLEELHRFPNDPVRIGDTLYWDVLRLFHEIKQGLLKAKAAGSFDSIGVDTWGVDFGLLDEAGRLLENPVHYRDARTQGMLEQSFSLLDKDRFYEITGNQFMEINTAFQLLSLRLKRPELLERAQTMLLMPDLFNYLLTGVKHTEYSIASTTQLLDCAGQDWSDEVIDALGLPRRLFTPVRRPGREMGTLQPSLREELGLPAVPVISIAGHDTPCAVLAAPAEEEDFLFVSCGTWSLFGTELKEPLISADSARFNLTNEGGYDGTVTFLKNIIGLWLIQESRRQWQREGTDYSYAELEKLALAAEPLRCFIDPDAPEFTPPGDLPHRVQEYCRRTGQYVPQGVGEIMRCIYESLALKYRVAYDEIRACTGKTYRAVHVVGGGAKDGLLCRMTASSCNCRVTAGPVEATVLGNIAAQLLAAGDLSSVEEARAAIARSQSVKSFDPEDADAFARAYRQFTALLK